VPTAEAMARLEEQNRLRTPPVRDLLSYSANPATFRPEGPESVVTGWGKIDGRPVYVFSYDFTVAGGSSSSSSMRAS